MSLVLAFLIPFCSSCYPPLSLIPELSACLCFREVLLTGSSVGILVKAACAKAFIPCLNGSTSLPPLTSSKQKGWLTQRRFSLSACSPVCSLHAATGFQTKCLLVLTDPLLIPHSRLLACKSWVWWWAPTFWAAPQWMGWRTHLCCYCSSSSACRLALMTEKWSPFR